MKRTMLAVAVAVTLAGCDSGQSPAGAGANATDGTGTSRSTTITQTTDMTSGRDRTIRSETPVLPILVESVRELLPDIHNPAGYILVSCGLASGQLNVPAIRESFPDRPARLEAMMDGTQEDFEAICAAYGVHQASRPVGGWEFKPGGDQGRYMMNTELANALASSEILSVIAEELAAMPGKTKSEYLELSRARFRELAHIWVQTFLEESKKDRSFSVDYSGKHPAPVHFSTSDGVDYAHDGGGAAITMNGISWYGRGYLKGTMHRVEVVQSNAVTIGRSKTGTATRDAATQEQSRANVQTQ